MPQQPGGDHDSFREDLQPTSDVLLIGFAGLQLTKVVPSFHWVGAFDRLSVSKLFVRDLRQTFYQCGIPGIADGAIGVAQYLRAYVRGRGIRHTVCIGTSAGGYAALLFGHLIGADEVHAFSPLTKLPTRTPAQMVQLAAHGNWSLFKVQLRLYTGRKMDRETFDLPRFMAAGNGRTRYHVYYGTGHERDMRHSLAIAQVPGVTLHSYESADHQLVTHLRDSDELARIIDAACARVTGQGEAAQTIDSEASAKHAFG